MLRVVVGGKQIGYYSAFIVDRGDFMIFILQTNTKLNIGDVVRVADNFASYEFVVVANRREFIYYCTPRVVTDLKQVIFNKSFKENNSLKAIIDSVGSKLYRVVNDFEVLNFTFTGDGSQFLGFCRTQYGLSYYIDKETVLLYMKLEELEKLKHSVTVFGNNLIDINLSVRSLNFINDKRISKVVHYASKGYSQVMFAQQNICFNRRQCV
ncbi:MULTISPECIES: hypothetical protein [unclassified Borrelia]|uniref:hypothetical protein n=1 Tax=unclassified Borrelia TaxID=2649934 RepID=UPI001E38EDC9|nr:MULTISPECIES: hypothetical protein [unclassified Borrelia]UGQ16685.1 hypothetical protein LSO06_05040 [Borrelia sp. RT5S]UGQ17843.1 hypothetical protein LSO05_05275 [Borrelia sp. RT1S]